MLGREPLEGYGTHAAYVPHQEADDSKLLAPLNLPRGSDDEQYPGQVQQQAGLAIYDGPL